MQEKISKIEGFLPANRDIFAAFAQFQSPQQVSQAVKLKYFDENLKEIAKMMVTSVYKEKEADDIDEVNMIGDLEEWLSGGEVKFNLRPKEELKIQRVQRAEKKQQIVQRNQQSVLAQQSMPPKVDRIQNYYQPQSVQSSTYQQSYQQSHLPPHHQQPSYQQPQQRPQSYYQTQPQQGRQNQIKYNHKQPETVSQNIAPILNKQHHKRGPYQKQTLVWIDSLSKCLNFPQKRFYLLPEMHPKRKC